MQDQQARLLLSLLLEYVEDYGAAKSLTIGDLAEDLAVTMDNDISADSAEIVAAMIQARLT